ncbi:SusD/RagB family nutrient-binding outer membrane lipoprotein (plasmid) [Pedobacter sp. BS3]|uniref:SusD/RagB family nutrient-binding outer membrane lipoprotein n=1 Tax=Pedobacter sp. BS3 TaxID=2567937 RepID=UPI0011F0631F|nr:SusD/RagB family nutrient-binding outer membrane lipoprotein [Pedobacter sp. BS3]TZF85962.1 SusD/RagB family nutrient-binding outer membrane lipoprotein [Pedobacter sp. BS3]
MKMNNIKAVFLILFLLPSILGCKKYLDINHDPNAPENVSEKLMLPAILSTFSFEVVGGWPVRTSSLLTKHLAYATAGPHEGNYRITADDTDNFWRYSSYTDVMNSSTVLIKKAEANGNPAYSAIAKIIIAWNMSYITDCFGDAPFSEAFKADEGIAHPKYDSQEEIYKQIQSLLDAAIVDAGKGTGQIPGSDDLIYGGDMIKWQHLAYTLKARFYLRLSNAPGYSASTQANLALQALDAGAITETEMPKTQYFDKAGAENPWYQYTIDGKWTTSDKPSIFYINLLSSMNDPRLPYQIDPVATGADAGNYVGVTNDAPPKSLVNYSSIGSFYSAADAPLYMLVYAEVPFIRAEAEFLKAGKVVNTNVINAYNAGIDASMAMYGITDALTINTYKASNQLSLSSATAYNQIMTQKYIANFLQFEPYNDFRRTGYPALTVNNEVYPGEELDIEPVIPTIPVRFPYPSSERSYNEANIPSSVPSAFLQALQIPVWWDNN